MRIVAEKGEASFTEKQFAGGTIYVGSHNQCHIVLPGDNHIAPRHLMIFEEGEKWFVEPLHDQYHMTRLNGHLLRERMELKDKDVITAGSFTIRVFPSEKSEDKSVPVQVIAKSHTELQNTLGYTLEDLKLPDTVIVKQVSDTFSLSRGRLGYLSALALRMLEAPDVRTLMTIVVDVMIKDFDACCAWVGLRSDAEGYLHLSTGKDLVGNAIDAPPGAKKFSFAVVECARAVIQQSLDDRPDRSAIASPLISPDGSLGMVYLESQPGKPRYNVADLDMLMFICNQMAIAIDRLLRLQAEQLDQIKSLDQELARKVQSGVAPWQVPQWGGLKVAVLAEPGGGLTTDFYDILSVGNDHAMVMIGQTPPGRSDTAISIAEASSAFRIGAVHKDSPQVLMRQINWLVFTTSSEPRHIHLALLSIEPDSGQFYLALAGNLHAYLLTSSGKMTKIKTPDNPLVGETRKTKFEAVRGKLNSEQSIVLASSGLFTLTSRREEIYEESHFVELLADVASEPPNRIMGELVDDISGFTGGKKHSSDITVLLLKKTTKSD